MIADRPLLIDRFGRTHTYLRVSVTDRCNLRCTYCMPEEGNQLMLRDHILKFEEIVRLCRIFASMGVTKVRLTGGEPLVRKELPTLVGMIATIPGIENIALTTNGVLLTEHLSELKQAGLTHLNISLDTLRPERFAQLTRRNDLGRVMQGIQDSIHAGFAPLKINIVAIRGFNDDELLDFVAWARPLPIEVRFIEFMPFDNNAWTGHRVLSYREMLNRITAHYSLTPANDHEGSSDVAKEYRIEGAPGRVAFITSMTEHFCDRCNRLRLSAEGALKPCLHDGFEVPLRPALRNGATDDELKILIGSALSSKKQAHAPAEQLVQLSNRTMISIGG